jgi:hypothetical protein
MQAVLKNSSLHIKEATFINQVSPLEEADETNDIISARGDLPVNAAFDAWVVG